ncbi:lamin tail domain-containing protein [Streptomyces sp. WMMC1477]|uniref:lamin tail domain-containing protein n=1 Tax=Streptomyces sp. WMMC1477 TaxID=3015155 RepID=UPI0022B61E46|nr:lamin tail domain-containing protein [Streptomyces sp. WMMC1477]MCZ7434726.1 lamin tail domain-containing protein [Streptomyces sp. WMMC1477]
MGRSPRVPLSVAGCLALAASLTLLAAPASPAASPDIVISEVYGGGGNSGAAYTNDFIELHNRGSAAVDVSGWSVQYASRSGTSYQVTELSGSIEPGDHYLVQLHAGTSGDGAAPPAPDATGSTNMSLSSGKVALVTGNAALGCGGDCDSASGVRDFVGYGDANDYETAAAPKLSNSTSAQRAESAADSDDNSADFTEAAPAPENSASSGGGGGGGGECGYPSTLIRDVQGSAHLSPLNGSTVDDVRGVVTAVKSNGFWFQDPCPDADPATSEGLFVYTSSAPGVQEGDEVSVDGTVSEYRPGGSSTANLTLTQLSGPSVTVLGTAALPAATVVGSGGRVPPSAVIDDDATGSVETSGSFDAGTDGIDFYESLESMRIEVPDPLAVGPTSTYGEIPVVGDGGANAGVATGRGGLLLREDDANPERVIVDDGLLPTPAVDTGTGFTGPATGVLDYSFGNFKLLLTETLTAGPGSATAETTTLASGTGEVTVASFNVENLSPKAPRSTFDALADQIVTNLGAPDIVAVQEAQDDNGPESGQSTGDQTWLELIDAVTAAGGPSYDYRQIDPQNGADGGQPGGNIRVGFLFRTDQVSFAAGTHGDATAAVQVSASGDADDPVSLSLNPGRIDPGNAAWDNSRKPLVGKFLVEGEPLYVIANHFNSKGGDDPLFGRHQPPARDSETQRHAQAGVVADFAGDILAIDPNAAVVVAGDLNDFEFSTTIDILEDAGLTNLPALLPDSDRYTYLYEGNSQVLDHLMISPSLANAGFAVDAVHANAEFSVQTTDHDPLIARLTLP